MLARRKPTMKKRSSTAEPRPLALVRYTAGADEARSPFKKSSVLVYLGEIPNMPGHSVVADVATGKIVAGYHTERFLEIAEASGPAVVCRTQTRFERAVATLASRERQVFDLTGAGFTQKQIGQKLGITVKTVGTHVHRACEKLRRPMAGRSSWRLPVCGRRRLAADSL